MDLKRNWQTASKLFGAVLFLIGIPGLLSDTFTWYNWVSSVNSQVLERILRWGLIATGLAFIIVPTISSLSVRQKGKQLFTRWWRRPLWRANDAILNCFEKDGFYISNFSVKGKNVTSDFIAIVDCCIVSHISGERLPVRLATNEGYALPEEVNPIPPGSELAGCAMFYDPTRIGEQNYKAGILAQEFPRDWGSFTFMFSYTKSRFDHGDVSKTKTEKHVFDIDYVHKQISTQHISVRPGTL